MKKLTLRVDTLRVDSFPTASAETLRGTVQGAEMATGSGASCFTSCAGAGGHPVCTCPIRETA